MSEKGLMPIVDKFLHPNYLFALEFQQGFVFGRVIRRRACLYKPYYLIDQNGNAVSIGPLSAQAELQFRDPRNTANSIPYLGQTINSGYPWIMHGSFGISPQYINAYPRMPAGKDISGHFPNLDPTRPSAGDNTGFVNGLLSPYDEPTDWLEIVIPPMQQLGCEYYNKDTYRTFQPKLNLHFCTYWFQVLNPPRFNRLISAIAMRQVPCAFHKVGFGDQPLDIGANVQKDWEANPMDLDEAAALGGA